MTDIKSLTLTELERETERLGEKNSGQNRFTAGCMRSWQMILTE